ncbi:hypothetical protein BZM27_34285 [Paraburkholderia steynii]|uniref:Transmembrane protein n=1 Tax=Paraburkholderia steynii TaxID=1245441 RepID=A0A4R0X8V4_9BURK|nr:hypothetical protein BZM27_34285 [Paraburkholderia steynii]
MREEARRLADAGNSVILASGFEARIAARVDRDRQDCIQDAENRLVSLDTEIAQQDVTTLVNDALQLDEEFVRKADAYLDQQSPALTRLGDSAHRAASELDKFRKKNGLTGTAKYPKGGLKAFMLTLIAASIMGEAGLNSAFFAAGLDSGLIGGFIYAAVLATLNVGVAFLFGRYPIRNIFHRSLIRKCFGGISLVLALLSMLCVSFAIAHFRGALAADVEAPGKAALTSFLNATIELDDITSWALVGISLFFAVLALSEGLLLDDRYPGYGDHDRDYRKARGAYDMAIRTVRGNIERIKSELVKQLENATKDGKAHLATYEANVERRIKAANQLDQSLVKAEQCMDALVRLFRAELKVYQKDNVAPLDYHPIPKFHSLPLPDFKIGQTRNSLGVQRKLLEKLLDEQVRIKAAVQSGFLGKFDTLRPIDDQFLTAAHVNAAHESEAITS